jgi:hypothetical protein
MSKVSLEIDFVRINRPKRRWRLYFIILAEHPTDSTKMVLTTLPSEPFLLKNKPNNEYHFDADTQGSAGLLVLSREMPEKKELNVHVYLRHSRDDTRNLGEVLGGIKIELGDSAFEIVTDILGTSAPWLVVAKKAKDLIGKILKDMKDRDFGFLSAYESFGKEFEKETERDYQKEFTGDATLVYSWSIE